MKGKKLLSLLLMVSMMAAIMSVPAMAEDPLEIIGISSGSNGLDQGNDVFYNMQTVNFKLNKTVDLSKEDNNIEVAVEYLNTNGEVAQVEGYPIDKNTVGYLNSFDGESGRENQQKHSLQLVDSDARYTTVIEAGRTIARHEGAADNDTNRKTIMGLLKNGVHFLRTKVTVTLGGETAVATSNWTCYKYDAAGTSTVYPQGEDPSAQSPEKTKEISVLNPTQGTYYASVQDAVTQAAADDIIFVPAGEYEVPDTITIDQGITLIGEADDDGNPTTVLKGDMNKDYDGIVISGNGTVSLENIKLTEFGGNRTARNVILAGQSGNLFEGQLNITNCVIDKFSKNGITVKGGEAVISNVCVDVANAGEVANRAPNGIQIDMGAKATISNTKVINSASTSQDWGATGILTLRGGQTTASNITFENCQVAFNVDATYDASDAPTVGNATSITDSKFMNCQWTLFNSSDTPVSAANNYWGETVPQFGDILYGNVDYLPFYIDEDMETSSKVQVLDTDTLGNLTVSVPTVGNLLTEQDVTKDVVYALKADTFLTSETGTVETGAEDKAVYVDISIYKDSEKLEATGEHTVNISIGEPVEGDVKVYHYEESAWNLVDTCTPDNGVITFTASSFSPFALVYQAGVVTESATEITVSLEKVTDTEYDIVLTGNQIINRFMSAELAFEYVPEEGTVAYQIEKVGDVNVIYPETGTEEYEFHMDGSVSDMTGQKLTIGKVVLEGYGKGSFSIKDTGNTFVNTAKTANNVVNNFIVNGDGVNNGILILPAQGEEIEIIVPQNTLKVNVTFYNPVNNNKADYQNMKAVISGGNLAEDITVDFGSDTAVTFENDTYTFTQSLAQGRYTVTISGAGYRTARYTVLLTEDKELNFWNNVMDTAEVIEVGKAESAVTKNFLAGDIVRDNQINIYDLSAVVSYFGTDNLVKDHPEYAKYDLNRDGVIDSRDVALVLVSWGN